jgi:hypothetical protein
MDLGLFILKLLAVAGGAAVGALLVGLVVQLAVRSMSTRPVPRPVLTTLRVLGAVAAGLAVWLWVFGPGGSGGFGGSGGWWPFGQKGGATGQGGTGRASNSEQVPTTHPQPEKARDTLTVTMRGGEEADKDQRFWVLQGDPPRDWESVTKAILERRRENSELRLLKIVTTSASVADNHPAVLKLKAWAREHGLETAGP